VPRIIVQAVSAAGEPRRWTLSERIVAENLDSDHYSAQLMQRLAWAAADAQALESGAEQLGDRRRAVRPAEARRGPRSRSESVARTR
jgi:hypothetical protein